MGNPYSSAMSRYTAIKADPLTYLEKEMRVYDLKNQIDQAGTDAVVALCGVALYRSLKHSQKDDVLQRIQNLIDKGYRELGGRLRSMVAGLIAFPYSHAWAMSIGELHKMAKNSIEVKDWISKTGLNLHLSAPSAMTVGTAIWLVATEGPRDTLLKLSNTDTVQAIGARLGKKLELSEEGAELLGKGSGLGFVLLVITMTTLYKFADIDEKRAEKEGAARGAYRRGWK